MNLTAILLEEAATGTSGTGASIAFTLIYVAIIVGFMYLVIVRPQKKQEQQHAAVLNNLEIGDSVLTTSGFYGIVIDIQDDMVIVEFGNNKNCRIPMQKNAIVEVEKLAQK